jgi:hypothetical protein
MASGMTGAALQAGLPELGPLLGRLAAPDAPVSRDRDLEPVRLELLSALFERAGKAREHLAAGDVAAARATLNRETWLALWEQAVSGAGAALLAGIERRMRDAAAVSRLPARRLAARLPDDEERRVLVARLSSAGIGLEEATKELANPAIEWSETIRRTAGELTGAWDLLRAMVGQEIDSWDRRTSQVREWRRPWRPLVLAGIALFVLAAWIGLVLGGFLPVPGFLRPVAEWYWSLPWP